jgi:hypothetical protein
MDGWIVTPEDVAEATGQSEAEVRQAWSDIADDQREVAGE